MTETKRVVLEFSSEAHNRLQALVRDAGKPSAADAVRDALRLYEWFLAKRKAGLDVVAVDRSNDAEYRVELE